MPFVARDGSCPREGKEQSHSTIDGGVLMAEFPASQDATSPVMIVVIGKNYIGRSVTKMMVMVVKEGLENMVEKKERGNESASEGMEKGGMAMGGNERSLVWAGACGSKINAKSSTTTTTTLTNTLTTAPLPSGTQKREMAGLPSFP